MLITLLITAHEPPSRVHGASWQVFVGTREQHEGRSLASLFQHPLFHLLDLVLAKDALCLGMPVNIQFLGTVIPKKQLNLQ